MKHSPFTFRFSLFTGKALCTLLFGVAAVLFFGLAYPHHLHYQEQYQLFLFDCSYVWEIVKLPGGIADLLGRFCTQFFLYAWIGALIIGILLSAVQLLTLRLSSPSQRTTSQIPSLSQRTNPQIPSLSQRTNPQIPSPGVGSALYAVSFVPSFLLWLFLLDENALLGGVWAVLLTLLAAWGFNKLKNCWARRILLIVTVPVLYWMVGPVCVVFFLLSFLGAARVNEANEAHGAHGVNGTHRAYRSHKANWLNLAWSCGALMLLAITIVVLTSSVPVPPEKLWFGIHYHRYPAEIPVLLWAAALSVFVLTLIVCASHRWGRRKVNISHSSFLIPLSSFLLVSVVMGFLVWKNSNFKAEKVMQYDFMARYQQWNRILQTVNAEKPNNQIGVTVQNLALAMRGMLADHLFEYNQNGIAGLLPDVQRDATSPLPTAEAFYQLGMIYVAQRTVFEAQEAILDFQKSARCYKRLAETNLILGNYEVARKYLKALQKTLFYSGWADETLQLLGNEEAIARHPEYGRLRQLAYNEDFYFGDQVTAEMLERLFISNTDNRLAFEYLKAYYILTGDQESYTQLLRHFQ